MKELSFEDNEVLAIYSVVREYLFDHPITRSQAAGDISEVQFQVDLRNVHRRIASYIGWPGIEPRPPFSEE